MAGASSRFRRRWGGVIIALRDAQRQRAPAHRRATVFSALSKRTHAHAQQKKQTPSRQPRQQPAKTLLHSSALLRPVRASPASPSPSRRPQPASRLAATMTGRAEHHMPEEDKERLAKGGLCAGLPGGAPFLRSTPRLSQSADGRPKRSPRSLSLSRN